MFSHQTLEDEKRVPVAPTLVEDRTSGPFEEFTPGLVASREALKLTAVGKSINSLCWWVQGLRHAFESYLKVGSSGFRGFESHPRVESSAPRAFESLLKV